MRYRRELRAEVVVFGAQGGGVRGWGQKYEDTVDGEFRQRRSRDGDGVRSRFRWDETVFNRSVLREREDE